MGEVVICFRRKHYGAALEPDFCHGALQISFSLPLSFPQKETLQAQQRHCCWLSCWALASSGAALHVAQRQRFVELRGRASVGSLWELLLSFVIAFVVAIQLSFTGDIFGSTLAVVFCTIGGRPHTEFC